MMKVVLLVASLLSLVGAGQEDSAVLQTTEPGVFGELKQWHRVTVAFEGPETSETAEPNPFTDYRLDVVFTHQSSGTTYTVPGYYAADGFAGETGATAGDIWRVHFSPGQTGEWTYQAEFVTGPDVATSAEPGEPALLNGDPDGMAEGEFTVTPTDKIGRDNRAKGRLEYVGEHYLRYAGSGEYFVKQGPDAPENLLAYVDFDGPFAEDGHHDHYAKTYEPHLDDWNPGDPQWQGEKGRGLIGAINYLASEGLNAFSFLTMNIEGDDRNVFPYLDYDERERMDVSRLDQWEVVFDHADRLGFFLHFKTQETENELLLDGGDLGPQRKLYYRELIARFGHHLALNWNLGEENDDQTDEQRRAMAAFFAEHDPYNHLRVIHTYPPAKEKIYEPLLGEDSELTGVSMQGDHSTFHDVHQDVLTWRQRSAEAGEPWVVAVDEPGNPSQGVLPDEDDDGEMAGNHTDARHRALWGTMMAGGAGNEWYFGYQHAHSDLTLQDFRSRDRFFDYCRYALEFFELIPFERMSPADELIIGAEDAYGLAEPGQVYALYLPQGQVQEARIDLSNAEGEFTVHWYDPRNGGPVRLGSVETLVGGFERALGLPPEEPDTDWVVLLRLSP
ncbi:MAG: DUF5060 domain-containing protein [Fimbriimonadaceae bacterium]